jgi:hypothetical protein
MLMTLWGLYGNPLVRIVKPNILCDLYLSTDLIRGRVLPLNGLNIDL